MKGHVGALLASLALVATACGAGTTGTTTTLNPSPPTTPGTNNSGDEPAATTTSAPAPITRTGDLRIIFRPGTTDELPDDLLIGCPNGPTFPASALDSSRPLTGSGLDLVEAAARGFLDDAEGQFWPQDDWQILHETAGIVLLVHITRTDAAGAPLDETRVAHMTIEKTDGEWRWGGASSGGPCPLRTTIPAQLNTVDWRLDPAWEPLTPASTRIGVLVTERECVSGQAVGDRLLGPEVVMTQNAVLIAFAADPPPGDFQNCPSNPEQAIVVELPKPLGDREVQDGLAVQADLADFLD